MSSSYGIAGSNPLAPFSSTVQVLLKDAIKAKWASDYTTPNSITYPLVTDIIWLNTWNVGYKDVEIIFLHGFLDSPEQLKTTDWRYQGHTETVDCHVWVRGGGGDVEPTALAKTLNGLHTVIAKNKATLIPNATVRIVTSQRAPLDRDDDFRNLWHYLLRIKVNYWSVSTV